MGPDDPAFLALSKTVSCRSGSPRTRGERVTIFQVEKTSQLLCGWCLPPGWFEGPWDGTSKLWDSVVPKDSGCDFLDDMAEYRLSVDWGTPRGMGEKDDPLKVCAGEECGHPPSRSSPAAADGDESAGMKSPAFGAARAP